MEKNLKIINIYGFSDTCSNMFNIKRHYYIIYTLKAPLSLLTLFSKL